MQSKLVERLYEPRTTKNRSAQAFIKQALFNRDTNSVLKNMELPTLVEFQKCLPKFFCGLECCVFDRKYRSFRKHT
jgi:hypothetical protein